MQVRRLSNNPLITCQTHCSLGSNINGPSVVRAPEWLARAPGAYLMYFAHHQGKHIRLASAGAVGGPWTVHPPGVLPLAQTPFTGHVASPDVHVDHEHRRLVMYFHGQKGPTLPGIDQPTLRATSADGLRWEVEPAPLCEGYLRLFHVSGEAYGVAKGGRLYRGVDGERFPRRFEKRKTPIDYSGRHWAAGAAGPELHLFYSRWGDCPEHILHARIDVTAAWDTWRIVHRQSLLLPEHEWEGTGVERRISLPGSEHHPVCELRDPAHFVDIDGRQYLFYSVAGEQGIAAAELLSP